MRRHFVLWKWLCTILLVASAAHAADTTEGLDQRLKLLEQRQDELLREVTTGRGRVRSFLSDDLSLGGFYESAITGITGSGTDAQLTSLSNILAVDLAAQLNEHLRFSSQVLFAIAVPELNPDNGPAGPRLGLPSSRRFTGLTVAALVPQSYFEFRDRPTFRIQAGIGYVPFGIAFQQRDFVLFRRHGGPQLINAQGGEGVVIASPVWSGLHVSGHFDPSESSTWGYDAYTLTPVSNVRTMGLGARAWLSPLSDLTIGASAQSARREQAIYLAYGLDAKYRLGRLAVDAEYARNIQAGELGNPWTFYVEPSLSFRDGKFLVYAVADYLDNPLSQTTGALGAASDPLRHWQYGGGVNWLPYSYTRIRLGFLFNDYVDTPSPGPGRDFCALDLSAGIEF